MEVLIAISFIVISVAFVIRLRRKRRSEVTSSNPAAILAQLSGQPLNEEMFERYEKSTPLYPRVRSAAMREILIGAGSLDREELVQAAIRGGRTREIAEAYADEIRRLADPGEVLPDEMQHAPNMGGDDASIPYQGGNYVEREEIAEEMRMIQWWHK